MKENRRRFLGEEKVKILRKHLVEKAPIYLATACAFRGHDAGLQEMVRKNGIHLSKEER